MTRTAQSTQRRKMRFSATGMAVGTVKMSRRRRRGTLGSSRRERMAGELMVMRAWVMISPIMNIMSEERVKRDSKIGSGCCFLRAALRLKSGSSKQASGVPCGLSWRAKRPRLTMGSLLPPVLKRQVCCHGRSSQR